MQVSTEDRKLIKKGKKIQIDEKKYSKKDITEPKVLT
jgi:hypothetical protein